MSHWEMSSVSQVLRAALGEAKKRGVDGGEWVSYPLLLLATPLTSPDDPSACRGTPRLGGQGGANLLPRPEYPERA